MPLVFSSLMHDLHNSFDVIKSELLLSAPTCSRGDDNAGTIPHSDPMTAKGSLGGLELASSASAAAAIQQQQQSSVTTKLKQQLHSKEERLASTLERLDEAQTQLQERDALVTTLVSKLALKEEQCSSLESELRLCKAALQDEKKQVIVLSERCSRHLSTIMILQESESSWRTWVEQTEAQAASSRDAVDRLMQSHTTLLASCERAKETERDLQDTKRKLSELTTTHAAVQDELACHQAASITFTALFNSTSNLCQQWVNEVDAAKLSLRTLTQELQLSEQKREELQQLLLTLSNEVAYISSAATPPPVLSGLNNSSPADRQPHISPNNDHEEPINTSSRLVAKDIMTADDEEMMMVPPHCPNCSLLESRLLEAAIEVSHRAEVVESLRQQISQLESEHAAPLLQVVDHQEYMLVDRVLVQSRWAELESLLLALVRDDGGELSATVPALRPVDAIGGIRGGGVSDVVESDVVPQPLLHSYFSPSTLDLTAAASATRAAQWYDTLEKLSSMLQSRDQRIHMLEGRHHQLHLQPTPLPRYHHTALGATSTITTATATGAVVAMSAGGPLSSNTSASSTYCGVCGWEVHGRRPSAYEDDMTNNSDMSVCRVCGDCFHKRCCRQTESLFVCHKHQQINNNNNNNNIAHHHLPQQQQPQPSPSGASNNSVISSCVSGATAATAMTAARGMTNSARRKR
ncbi:Hypothetical protein, putative [Bodo saltans]|uniref:Uncharacterized protein n=1 Tax=Bodo saltans TaxID=75058 RepID=A0A0S4J7C8_BODSA|nr:Hypothetical protein, putative [Bodo saltans]|eukprot:CUG87302.1 Hypothetical protein, putative [Bodo saltans]